MKPVRDSDVPGSEPGSGTRIALSDLRFADALTALEVERMGSMSKAARAIGVTPSQVSKTIGRLQASVGGPLFERIDSELTTTALGRRVLDRLRVLPSALKEVARERDLLDVLRIAATPFASMLIARRLAAATRGRFALVMASDMNADVQQGDIDLAFTLTLEEPPRSVRIGKVAWSLYARPSAAPLLTELLLGSEGALPYVAVDDPIHEVAVAKLLPHAQRAAPVVPVYCAIDVASMADVVLAFPSALVAPAVARNELVVLTGAPRFHTTLACKAQASRWDSLAVDLANALRSIA